MIKWIKDHKIDTVFIIAAIIFLGFPLFLNWFAKFMKQTGFTAVGDSSTWIGFFGSYFGSIITLFAIGATYIISQKQIREEKRMSIIPYLHVELDFDNDNENEKKGYILKGVCYFHFRENIKNKILHGSIKNIGLGTVIDLYITKINNLENKYDSVSYIRDQSTDELKVFIANDLLPQQNMEEDTINIEFVFADILGNKYKQIISPKVIAVKYDDDSTSWYIDSIKINSPDLIR